MPHPVPTWIGKVLRAGCAAAPRRCVPCRSFFGLESRVISLRSSRLSPRKYDVNRLNAALARARAGEMSIIFCQCWLFKSMPYEWLAELYLGEDFWDVEMTQTHDFPKVQ